MSRSAKDREAAEALEVVTTVAQQGIAAIERGDFSLVHGHEGGRALMARLNERHPLKRQGLAGICRG